MTIDIANAQILEASLLGERLPDGELWFQTPLVLTNRGLKGTGQTILRAMPGGPPSTPILTVQTPLPDSDPDLGLPRRVVISDVRIVGSGPEHLQYGIFLDAACVRFERVEVVHCYLGLAVKFAVDVAFRDCIFSRNATHVYLPALGGNTVTTLRFSGCHLRQALSSGAVLQTGLGVTFDDRTIIEANAGPGVVITDPLVTIGDIRFRDVWFEANGTNVVDPHGIATFENCRMS